jgi:Flp pilus assembly protein TadB
MENRRKVILLQRRKGIFHRMEQTLLYSGLVRRFPYLTPEIWILTNLVVVVVFYSIGNILFRFTYAGLFLALVWIGFVYIFLRIKRNQNDRSVNEHLLKFLDFLGNYSVTAGEITGILNQVSRFVKDPLKSVLEECYSEAQTSGDVKLALLMMSEKIEHPMFKELVRNMEISIRYSADFTVFVSNSKRAVREYLRSRQERKALASEALINMLLLVGMSLIVFVTMENLIAVSAWSILFHTIPGQIGIGVIVVIFGVFFHKISRLD